MPLFGENFDSQFNARTYRELETPDRPTGHSAVKAAADYYFNLYKQEEKKRETEERQRFERQRQREAAGRQRVEQEKAARDHRERLAVFEANEHLIAATMDAYQLTPEEKAELTIQLGSRATDLAAVEWACQRIMDLKEGRT